MDFATDFLSYVGLTVLTLLPIINPVGTAVLLLGIGAHLEPAARERQIRRPASTPLASWWPSCWRAR
jgi:multiple antibiotic resistance protein